MCTYDAKCDLTAAYSQVCGQARGYQYGDVTAFTNDGIDSLYASGLLLTHRASGSRAHIWTFANDVSSCPCALNSDNTPLSFVGSNYFCESGVASGTNIFRLLDEDPLWDGLGCDPVESLCCEFNSPPYFSTQLPSATTNNIEGRICNSVPEGFGNTFITFLELFVK